jgi:hypothetical protein
MQNECGPAPTLVPPPTVPPGHPRAAIKAWGVYVFNFIGMVQENRHHRRHVKQVLLIPKVWPAQKYPPLGDDAPPQGDIASSQ